MTKRDFLRLTDLSLAEAREVLALAHTLKHEPKGTRTGALRGRSVAIIMEKASTRTRVSFEVGVAQLGAHPVVLGLQGSQLGRGEPIRDTARVLSGYCDAIVYRTFETSRLLEMAEASIPVVNALSDDGHPVQILCDVFTIEEALAARGDTKGIAGRRVAWVGDGSSNMARSFVEAAPLFGVHLAIAARFHTVVLEGVPVLGPEHRNAAKRLVTRIDALYEDRDRLVVLAEAEPEALYRLGDGSFEFERTASRLREMQGADWGL